MRRTTAALVAVSALAACAVLAGITKSLPFAPENDEPVFVHSAARIAASGNLNPQWFGHPGSTVIYPLALLYKVTSPTTGRVASLRADAELLTGYSSRHAWFYLVGRLVSLAYFVAAIPLVYRVGCLAFGERVGLVGAWLSSIVPLSVSHAQLVRTDSAGMFFGLLGLLCVLRLLDDPAPRHQLLAGAAIGLGVATRYFMVALVPVWVLANLLSVRLGRLPRSQMARATTMGLVAVAVSFLVATPYFAADFHSIRGALDLENEPAHLGADGLSFAGNLRWYVAQALPDDLSWPQAVAVGIGVGAALWRRRPAQLVLVGFVALFLAVISLSHLHWHRWTIQLVPVYCLFAAQGLDLCLTALQNHFLWNARSGDFARLLSVLLLSAQPAYQLVRHELQQMRPTTRIQAREWVLRHVPPGSTIVEEQHSAPLSETSFRLGEQYSLATAGSPEEYSRQGYQYAIVSSGLYARYLAEPERYRRESAFYGQLFATKELLAIFSPLPHPAALPAVLARDCYCSLTQTRGEPTIRVYRLTDAAR